MSDRSIKIGRDSIGSANVSGDNNQVRVDYRGSLPQAEDVDNRADLEAIRALLQELGGHDPTTHETALSDAETEAKKEEPDADELGDAMDRAIKYAKKANGFAEQASKLKPHLEAVCGWLGQNWHKLLSAAGFGAAVT